MKSLNISKFNWMVIGIILLVFLGEYHYLSYQFDQKSMVNLKSDFRTVTTGVARLTNNYEYGAAITRYRVETMSRQTLRYNINYVNEKIIGTAPVDKKMLAERVRQVMNTGAWDHFIIMGLYDYENKQFLVGNEYFGAASALPSTELEALIKSSKVKEEAFKSFALGNTDDLFNRIDVFIRHNPSTGVAVIGAIPRVSLREAYEDNVDLGLLHSELMGNHSPKEEGYILLYDKKGTVLATNWRNNGSEVFLHNQEGKKLYDLMANKPEKVITFNSRSKSGEENQFYAYGDFSGDTLIVVVKDKVVEDFHKDMVQVILKVVTVIMMMLMAGLIYLVHDAKPEGNLFG